MSKHRVSIHAGACEGGSYGGHVNLEIQDVISGVTIMSIDMTTPRSVSWLGLMAPFLLTQKSEAWIA